MAGIVMYGTTWCPDCKRAKQFFGEQRIPYDWIDVERDPEAMRYIEQVNRGKQIIPTIVFPDGSVLVEPSNAELAQKMGIQTKASRSYYDLVIVGGGPAGLTTAIYAAREGMDTLVVEAKGMGGQAAVTERIDNYPGFHEGITGDELGKRLVEQARRFGVELLGATEVSGLDAQGSYRAVRTTQGGEYCAAAALLATGSRYRRLNIPGEEDFIGAGVHFCATCDGPFYKGEELLVIGGGNSGLQESLFLRKFASKVTIVEFLPQLQASAILQQKVAEDPNIAIRTNTQALEMRGDGRLRSVLLQDRGTQETWEMRPAGVFVFIGLQPNSEAFQGLVETDRYGFIVTKQNLETSLPGVFAAGDVRAGSTKQIAAATGEGATAALMVRHYLNEGARTAAA